MKQYIDSHPELKKASEEVQLHETTRRGTEAASQVAATTEKALSHGETGDLSESHSGNPKGVVA